jgi:hypothetical protein
MQPSHKQYSCVPSKRGSALFLDEFVAFLRAQPQCIRSALERKKELGSMLVFPRTGVDRSATQTDEDGHVLNAHRALEFARSAGGALEDGLLRVVLAQQGLIGGAGQASFKYARTPEDDFFGVEQLASIRGWAVLCAAAALHAGVGLQAD